MMIDLPADLVEEILSRIPATSLIRLRSTCKQWNALFKNQRFTEKHFRKAPKQSMVLLLKYFRVCSMSVNLNVVPPSIEEFMGEVSLKETHSNSEEVYITSVFHCDGLLLCTTQDCRLVVWNPCLGETKWIQLETDYDKYSTDFALGYLNNNKSCRSYKILRYCWDGNVPNHHHFVASEIYEFSSDSWRVLDIVSRDYFKELADTGVSLKGNTYWLASSAEGSTVLLSFDFTTERFKRLYLPKNVDADWPLSIVREEQLSVLIQNPHKSEIEIWMAKNINTEGTLSWKKSFTVSTKMRDIVPDSFLIDEEKRLVVCCLVRYSDNLVEIIGEGGEYYTNNAFVQSRNWQWRGWLRPCILNYVPSLVQIQRAR